MQPLAPFLAFGQMLEQQPSRAPSFGPLFRCQPNDARDLLGLGEEALRRLGEALAFQRHDPLIALVAHRMIEGDREIALAE